MLMSSQKATLANVKQYKKNTQIKIIWFSLRKRKTKLQTKINFTQSYTQKATDILKTFV